ncbi:FERM protein [Ancylostoma duodenale]|uniref:FERM protein n=1 Tax=Ancylostoma duodenale TaxID=51022 RepID=A0A0C2CK18_9BILA|nr:FERM protein [Ancylostoma duodenale]
MHNQKTALASEVYDQVFYSLDLEEKDYFGLQFTDHYHVQHWLDPMKKLVKQVPIGPPFTFRFRVKFYTTEPSSNLKEELTRYI